MSNVSRMGIGHDASILFCRGAINEASEVLALSPTSPV
eukprot:CAMPEP_0183391448 /NCGR_PEP_ID=MMETSP0370-20130417/6427_1 /TAXON_ID=268820 /ORGANISM="Peridinium aciculiferum, Strain PAER-2" /LENGTH=37 /DNA_ID= /DNA_START= /DNA_END= /DNA_ORIENTATION=